MKKAKLIVSSLLLALLLTIGGGFGTGVYASGDDPQGTSGTPKSASAPQQTPPGFWEAILAALAAIGL